MKADPQAFLDKFDESKTEQSLSSVPVLQSINSDAFAEALLNQIQNRRDMAIQIGHLIFDRLRKNRSIYVSEVGWLELVVDRLKKTSVEIDPVLEAQVGWFCGRFLQPPSCPLDPSQTRAYNALMMYPFAIIIRIIYPALQA